MRKNLPDKSFFLGKCLPTREDILIQKHVQSGNDGHVFRGYSNKLQREFACKLIPRANLITGPQDGAPIWRAEIEKANALRNPMVVRFVDVTEWVDLHSNIDCVVLISDFIEGMSLRDFIHRNRPEITVSFIIFFLETVFELFNEMASRSILHGDFHAGNILVEHQAWALNQQYAIRVTDFGVANASADNRFKDDYQQLAYILKDLLETVDYPKSSLRDKFLFNSLNNEFLGRHLIERDNTIDPLARNPKELYQRLRELHTGYESSGADRQTQLTTPFDYLSCEQIGDVPDLIRALYSDLFLGLSEIESKNNVVVTGPRGCGKSTVFKNLSLLQRLRVDEDAPGNVNYIAIYYGCLDLYFGFPRYKLPHHEDALDIPLHFVTATLLCNLLESLERWSQRHFEQEWLDNETRVARLILDILDIKMPKQVGPFSFRAIVTVLQKQRELALKRQLRVNDVNRPDCNYFGPSILSKVCACIQSALPFLKGRPFYFLIDDYSSPKITKALQENLNRIFMQRNSVCFFKLSTESPVSFSRCDIDGKVYVESREFALHNLGSIYLHAGHDLKLQFINDIFRRRFTSTTLDYPVKELHELLGSAGMKNFNDEARQIRENKKPEHWGNEVLCYLCSGDIHYLISLVRDMITLVGGDEQLKEIVQVPKVSPKFQNKAIRQAAGSFLKNLRSIPKHGDRLVEIVTAFGNVAHSYLRCKESSNQKGSPPHQATRIEPYDSVHLSDEAQQIYDELLRYSVFIEDYRGKSRRGAVVQRLYLRRFLIPHFNLTFSMRDSIQLEPAEFQRFLLNPLNFERERKLRKRNVSSLSGELPLEWEGDLP